jgi:hypothetical protein
MDQLLQAGNSTIRDERQRNADQREIIQRSIRRILELNSGIQQFRNRLRQNLADFQVPDSKYQCFYPEMAELRLTFAKRKIWKFAGCDVFDDVTVHGESGSSDRKPRSSKKRAEQEYTDEKSGCTGE